MALLLFLAGHMLFVGSNNKLAAPFYKQSYRLMGVAFIFVPISCFIYTESNLLDLMPRVSSVISLSAYYATFVFMILSFLILLGHRFSRWIFILSVTVVLLYPIPMVCSLLWGDDTLSDLVITASYTYFVVMIVTLVVYVLYRYRVVTAKLEDYYSGDILICIRWVEKSIELLTGLALTCILAPVFFKCPIWVRFLFMLYGVLCYLHIHYGYRSMSMNLALFELNKSYSVSRLVDVVRGVGDRVVLSNEVINSLEAEVDMWIADRGFCTPNVTIIDVAKSVNTNRTYLSKFINSRYGCSFRVWITQLRLEEAKVLLAEHPDMSISDVSNGVGAASVESFIHVFTRNEGIAPNKWRDKHSANVNPIE